MCVFIKEDLICVSNEESLLSGGNGHADDNSVTRIHNFLSIRTPHSLRDNTTSGKVIQIIDYVL